MRACLSHPAQPLGMVSASSFAMANWFKLNLDVI